MTNYRTLDGAEFTANSPQELIEALRRASRNPGSSSLDFMQDTARRCRIYNGAWVRWSSPSEFVEDLEQSGFISKIEAAIAP